MLQTNPNTCFVSLMASLSYAQYQAWVFSDSISVLDCPSRTFDNRDWIGGWPSRPSSAELGVIIGFGFLFKSKKTPLAGYSVFAALVPAGVALPLVESEKA